MHILALDTTTREGSVSIVSDAGVLVETRGDASRSHAERLPADLLRALELCGLSSSDIDVFAVACGPGSFTGLRIGIATIQGLAFAHNARVVPVSALTALAEAASQGLAVGALVGAWMDANRREVFSALFRVGSEPPFAADRLRQLDPPAVGTPTTALDRWRAAASLPDVIGGDGAVLYRALVPAPTRVFAPPPLASIIGRLALGVARAGRSVPPSGVQPLYVRRSDAELARDLLVR
jgi:tRNA threonylcarbamoyladenosine biosynthesis protein TsaB